MQGGSLRTALFPLLAVCVVAVQLAFEVKLDLFPLLASLRTGATLAHQVCSSCQAQACCTRAATLAGARQPKIHACVKVKPDWESYAVSLHDVNAAQSTE